MAIGWRVSLTRGGELWYREENGRLSPVSWQEPAASAASWDSRCRRPLKWLDRETSTGLLPEPC